MNTWSRAVLLGVGATFLTEIWAMLLLFFIIKSKDLFIVGNWVLSNLFGVDPKAAQNGATGLTKHSVIWLYLTPISTLKINHNKKNRNEQF